MFPISISDSNSRFRDSAIPRFCDIAIPRFFAFAIPRFRFRDFAILISRFCDFLDNRGFLGPGLRPYTERPAEHGNSRLSIAELHGAGAIDHL